MPITDKAKQEYLGQLTAFFHAQVDNELALIEARRKSDGTEVLLACIAREVHVPPRVLGGEPTTAQQIVPIFEFIDPHLAENPYESADPGLVDVNPSAIVLPDSSTPARDAIESLRAG